MKSLTSEPVDSIREEDTDSVAIKVDQFANADYSLEAYFNAVRFSLRSQVLRILEKHKDMVHELDPQGYSAVHWASKKGDIEMLHTLYEV